jgi:hypothetical protein
MSISLLMGVDGHKVQEGIVIINGNDFVNAVNLIIESVEMG